MVHKKSKKTTTHGQFEIMVDYLQNHPQLIGFVPGASEKTTDRRKLWNKLAEILNEHGPPTRSCAEWKSIWSDYKYNIKRKLCADFKFSKGRHPEKRLLFSLIEGKVINMLNLKEKLGGKQYKLNPKPLPRRQRRKRAITRSKKPTIDHDETTTTHCKPLSALSEDENEESVEICSELESLDEKTEFVNVLRIVDDPDKSPAKEQDKDKSMECDVTLMLNDTLQGMQKTQLEILKELKEYNRQKKHTHDFKEQQLNLEREKFEEQKRQNVESNKRATLELELKQRELELYEMKLKGSCTSCVVKTETAEFVVSSF